MPEIPNPFHTLRVVASASPEEIVANGTAQIQAESGDERKRQYHAAVEALTTHSRECDYHRFWEPAGAVYEDPAGRAFVERYAAGPVDRDALNRRARVFLEQECSGEALAASLIPPPSPPPGVEQYHPAGIPLAHFETTLDLTELFR